MKNYDELNVSHDAYEVPAHELNGFPELTSSFSEELQLPPQELQHPAFGSDEYLYQQGFQQPAPPRSYEEEPPNYRWLELYETPTAKKFFKNLHETEDMQGFPLDVPRPRTNVSTSTPIPVVHVENSVDVPRPRAQASVSTSTPIPLVREDVDVPLPRANVSTSTPIVSMQEETGNMESYLDVPGSRAQAAATHYARNIELYETPTAKKFFKNLHETEDMQGFPLDGPLPRANVSTSTPIASVPEETEKESYVDVPSSRVKAPAPSNIPVDLGSCLKCRESIVDVNDAITCAPSPLMKLKPQLQQLNINKEVNGHKLCGKCVVGAAGVAIKNPQIISADGFGLLCMDRHCPNIFLGLEINRLARQVRNKLADQNVPSVIVPVKCSSCKAQERVDQSLHFFRCRQCKFYQCFFCGRPATEAHALRNCNEMDKNELNPTPGFLSQNSQLMPAPAEH